MIKIIKLNARRALCSSHSTAIAHVLILEGTALLSALISSLAYGILSFDGLWRDLRFPPAEAVWTSGIILFIFFAFIAPFAAGVRAWYYRLSEKGQGEAISFSFIPYENAATFFNCIKLSLVLTFKKFFTYALFTCIPAAITFYAKSYLSIAQTPRESFLAYGSLICGTALTLLTAFFAYTSCLKYFAVPYIFAENGFSNVKEAFKISQEACRDEKGALLIFNISLLFYYILNLCPVTALYSYPYIQSAKAIYARFLLEKLKRQQIDFQNNKL